MVSRLGQWVLGLSCTALICGAIKSLAPGGWMKRAVEAVCAAAMVTAALGILGDLAELSVSRYAARYASDAGRIVEDAGEEAKRQTRFIIEERCEAYILDKAASLGAPLEGVSVTAEWSGEGFWYPARCVLTGRQSPELSRAIEAELGIPKEEQTWRDAGEG